MAKYASGIKRVLSGGRALFVNGKKNPGWGSIGQVPPGNFVFPDKASAQAFKAAIPRSVRGKASVRKTKGWSTYSVIFTGYAMSDLDAVARMYRPAKSSYKTIQRETATWARSVAPKYRSNPRKGRKKNPSVDKTIRIKKYDTNEWEVLEGTRYLGSLYRERQAASDRARWSGTAGRASGRPSGRPWSYWFVADNGKIVDLPDGLDLRGAKAWVQKHRGKKGRKNPGKRAHKRSGARQQSLFEDEALARKAREAARKY